MISRPHHGALARLGRAASFGALLAAPLGDAGAQSPPARGPLVVCDLADARADALRGALAAALARPPAGLTVRHLEPGPPEALPARLRRLGATDGIWARSLPGGRVGLRYFRAEPGEVFEAELPAAAVSGPPAAVAEAFWLKLQFMMAAPPGTGRPWPPVPPVPGPPDPALSARLDVPRARPWPPLPAWVLPEPPAALPGPPPPQGEVEIVIEARPGAETPAMIFSPTAEHGAMAAPRADAPPTTPTTGDDPVRLGLGAALDLPTPWSAGGRLELMVPTELAGTPLWARFGASGLVAHDPWDSTAADGGPLAVWRADARLGVALATDALHLWAGGGPFVAHLARIGSAGDARLLDAWQAGLDAGTLVGWDLGAFMPFAGFALRGSPQSLRAASDDVAYTLAARWQIGVELGVAVSLGR